MIAPLLTGLALIAILVATARPLGAYIDDVFEGRATPTSRILLPLERALMLYGGEQD